MSLPNAFLVALDAAEAEVRTVARTKARLRSLQARKHYIDCLIAQLEQLHLDDVPKTPNYQMARLIELATIEGRPVHPVRWLNITAALDELFDLQEPILRACAYFKEDLAELLAAEDAVSKRADDAHEEGALNESDVDQRRTSGAAHPDRCGGGPGQGSPPRGAGGPGTGADGAAGSPEPPEPAQPAGGDLAESPGEKALVTSALGMMLGVTVTTKEQFT